MNARCPKSSRRSPSKSARRISKLVCTFVVTYSSRNQSRLRLCSGNRLCDAEGPIRLPAHRRAQTRTVLCESRGTERHSDRGAHTPHRQCSPVQFRVSLLHNCGYLTALFEHQATSADDFMWLQGDGSEPIQLASYAAKIVKRPRAQAIRPRTEVTGCRTATM